MKILRIAKIFFYINTCIWVGSSIFYLTILDERWFSRICVSLFCYAMFVIIHIGQNKCK